MAKSKPLLHLIDVSFEDIMIEPEIISSDDEQASNKEVKTKKGKDGSASTFDFSILSNYGKVSNKKNSATFTLVEWQGCKRYDLRGWNEDYSVPYKGISFTNEEIMLLKEILSCFTLQHYSQPLHVFKKGKTRAEIYQVVGVLSTSTVQEITWNKQVSIVDWGYGQKFDFRKWTEDYSKCSKGICLTKDEVDVLISMLRENVEINI